MEKNKQLETVLLSHNNFNEESSARLRGKDPRIVLEPNEIGQSNLLKRYKYLPTSNGHQNTSSSLISIIKNKINKTKTGEPLLSVNSALSDKFRQKNSGKENQASMANLPFKVKVLKSEESLKSHIKHQSNELTLSNSKTPDISKQKKTVQNPDHKMMSRFNWLIELKRLYEKIKRTNDKGVVSKESFINGFKKTINFMDLVERSQYKTSKNELGLSVNNIERRLLNISHNELDEDMIIKVAMLEAADTGELESSGKKKLHQQNESKRNASNFFYEENSEFSEKKSNSKLKWEERENQLVPKYVGEQEAEPRRRKRKTDSNCNSIGQMGSSSNRVFEKRRSSSKSEVETARFNKVEGLTSSRNLDRDSKALSSRREMERFRNKSDFTPEQAHKTAEPPLYSSNTPLLNTFSTIKPTDQFDFINNSSTKNQKGMLTQLEKQIKSYHLEDTFEFTELESKNQSVHARKCFPGTLTQTSYETNKNLKASLHKDTQSTNVGLKSMKTMTSQEGHGDRSKERAINLKIEDHLKNQSRQSKRSLKNSMDMTGHSRKKSKSKDCMTKRVTENISKIIESINKSVMGGEATKEEQAILDALAGLHVFEFKNACVLGLDLRDLGDVFKATEGTLLNSVYFKQLVNNIGILRIRNSSITGKFINAVSHSNIILLSINQCGLTSLTHISHLSNLKLLNASDNHLKNMSGIQKCSNLTELYANNNQLASLHELKGLQGLKVLSVCYNIISDVSEFQYLRRNTQLGYLKVLGNPICYMKEYHSTIFNILPKLKRIDYFDIEISDFKDFYVLWKEFASQYVKEAKIETSKRHKSAGEGARSKRDRSNCKSKRNRELKKSMYSEENLELYGFLKQKETKPKLSLSKLMLNRQESAPLLLRDKITQICVKGLMSSKTKESAVKSSASDKRKKKSTSLSIAGKKLIF